ncbi:hypothetical protein Tco_0659330, partial [Tanacetum coccineum]
KPISQETSSDGGPKRQQTMEGSSFGNRLKVDKEGLWYCLYQAYHERKKLEKTVKTSQARRKAKIVVSDDDMASEDSSKQGRMIYEIDQDVGVTLVTPTKVNSQEDQPEDQLRVLSAAKVLADAAKVHTYSRRRRAVSTGSGEVSTASRIVSTAGMIQQVNIIIPSSSAKKDKAKAIMTESEPEQTTTKLKQRQERAGYEATIRLQEQLDEEESQRIARDAEVAQRLQEELDAAKKQKMAQLEVLRDQQKLEENDAEKEELRACLDIVSGDEIAMDFESLATKYPIIDWKTHILTENMMYYQIIRADGSSKNYKIFSEMLDDFDRQDVVDLHRLVKERYETTSPEGYDLLLWGDLKTLFEPFHVLLMDNGIAIHMMIEKKYPLTQEMLSRMINRRLEVDHESEMAFELLGFTRSQLQKSVQKGSTPKTPLLVGRGFLATANAVIDSRKAKIAVGEGITRSVFGVKGVDLGEEEAPYWTTLGKMESTNHDLAQME